MARWIPPAGPGTRSRGEVGEAGAGPGTGAAASSGPDDAYPSPRTAWAALAFLLAGCFASVPMLGTPGWGPSYAPAAGVGAFALFYVVAQAVERLVEVLVAVLPHAWTFDKPGAVRVLDHAVVAALADPADGQGAADARAALDQAVANRTVLTFGLAGALGALACGYLDASFLEALGVDVGPGFVGQLASAVVTALVVGGGSKQLHDLITRVGKSTATATAAGS